MRDAKIICLWDWRQKKRQRVGAIAAALDAASVFGLPWVRPSRPM
jgi:hypothetical protein